MWTGEEESVFPAESEDHVARLQRQLRELPRSQMMVSWATLKTLDSAVAWGGGGVGCAFVGKQAA